MQGFRCGLLCNLRGWIKVTAPLYWALVHMANIEQNVANWQSLAANKGKLYSLRTSLTRTQNNFLLFLQALACVRIVQGWH